MFGLENRGETLISMLRHFDETMTILISHFGAHKGKSTTAREKQTIKLIYGLINPFNDCRNIRLKHELRLFWFKGVSQFEM